ncbi:expressed protein [Phakopsora pachyrhizi]|uniref:Expressed protein n=1 Tax=Phakopsora pachyrhizi TaxID=170000 RepID=A0AAV0BMF2_PHAPC|nr:expressed protein [Phakopsora pachyrhizi]
MTFSITYLCLAAFKIISASASFSKGSPFKTCMETAEGARTENLFSSQNNLAPLANFTPHMEKQSQAEHRINLLSTNEDVTPHSLNNKRNYKEAFEMRDARTGQPYDIVKEPSFSPPSLSDWGDDLMFSATEWDVYPTYSIDSHSAGTHNNLASALVGLEHDYHDYYPQKVFSWENNLEWMPQPGAVESLVLEKHYFGESCITTIPTVSSLIEREPTAGIGGNIESDLVNNIRLLKQEEPRELQEKRNSDDVFGNSHSFHFKQNFDVFQNSRTAVPQNNIIEEPDLQILEKELPQILYLGKKNHLEKKDVLQRSQSSSNVAVRRPHTIRNNANYQSVDNENKIENFSGAKKILRDVINNFKQQLKGLGISRSTESTLSLFLETSDKYADNLPDEIFGSSRKKTKENLENNSQNTFINLFLAHSEFSISLSLLDKLRKYFEKCGNDGYKQSYRGFNRFINDQVKKNGGNFFYISDKQVKNFLNLNIHDFKVESLFSKGAKIDRNYYANYLAHKICTAIEFIPWEVISTSDEKISLFGKRELYQKEMRNNKIGADYGALPTLRFTFRKIFLLYSTLINKIYCSGEHDTQANFIVRQKAAMDFFDMTIRLIEIDSKDTDIYFIRNESFPLDEDASFFFFKRSYLSFPTDRFQFKIVCGERNKVDTAWKFIALWMAKEKYEYFKKIYCQKLLILNFKNFFSSLFFYILEAV